MLGRKTHSLHLDRLLGVGFVWETIVVVIPAHLTNLSPNGEFQYLPDHGKVSREHLGCDDAKSQIIMHIPYLKIKPMARAYLPGHETITKLCRCGGKLEHAIGHLSYVLLVRSPRDI